MERDSAALLSGIVSASCCPSGSIRTYHLPTDSPDEAKIKNTALWSPAWGNILFITPIATAIAGRLVENSEIFLPPAVPTAALTRVKPNRFSETPSARVRFPC